MWTVCGVSGVYVALAGCVFGVSGDVQYKPGTLPLFLMSLAGTARPG